MNTKLYELPIRSITFHNKLKMLQKKTKIKKKIKKNCNNNSAKSFSDEELDYDDEIKHKKYDSKEKEIDILRNKSQNDKNIKPDSKFHRNKLNSFEESNYASINIKNMNSFETKETLLSADELDQSYTLSGKVKNFCDEVKESLNRSISLTSLSKLVNISDFEDDAKCSSLYDFDNYSLFDKIENTCKINESEKEDILENWRKRRRLEKFKKEGEKDIKMAFKNSNAMEEHLVDEKLRDFYQKFKRQSFETDCAGSIENPKSMQQPCQHPNNMASFNYSQAQSNICQPKSSVNNEFNHHQLPTISECPINFHSSHQSLYQNNLLQQQSFLINIIKSFIEQSNKKENVQLNTKSSKFSTVSTQTTPEPASCISNNKLSNHHWVQHQKARLSKKRDNNKINKKKSDFDTNVSIYDSIIDKKEELNDLLEISDSEDHKDDDVLILMRQRRIEILKKIKILL